MINACTSPFELANLRLATAIGALSGAVFGTIAIQKSRVAPQRRSTSLVDGPSKYCPNTPPEPSSAREESRAGFMVQCFEPRLTSSTAPRDTGAPVPERSFRKRALGLR